MNGWIDSLNALSAAGLDLLLRASWQGGIALAVVWLIARFVSRLPAAHKVWLWRLAFFKLLAGLIWLSPVVLPVLPQRTSAVPVPEIMPMTVAHVEPTTDLALPAITVQPIPSSLQLSGWIFLAWCAAILVCALRVFRHWRATRRLLRGSRPLRNATAEGSVRALCERLRRRRPPSISESPAISSPLLVGIFRPQIILPRGLADSASTARLDLMLAHELAHLRRRDLLWLWLFTVGETLFFFHPLVWLARREWTLATEVACDEMAIRLTRQTPRDYGEMLVDIVAATSRGHAPSLVAVGIVENANTLKRRLKLMITTRTRFARIGGVALITIATLGLVPWKLAAQDADAEVVAKLKEENAQLRKQLEAMRRDAEKMRADEEQLRNPATAERRREAALQRETAERNAQLARNHERQKRDIEAIRVEQLRLAADQQRRTEELQARLQALRKQFTDNNPLVRQTQAQLEVMEEMGAALTRAQANGHFLDPLEANKEAAAANERAMKRQDQQKQQRTQEQQEQQRALLQKEIELAERHVEYVRKELENGKTIPTALLTAQRELLEVRLQLARLSNSNFDQRAVLLQQLNAAEHMLKENKKRVEVGTMSPGAEIPFEREVLRIKRQLHEFEDSDVRE